MGSEKRVKMKNDSHIKYKTRKKVFLGNRTYVTEFSERQRNKQYKNHRNGERKEGDAFREAFLEGFKNTGIFFLKLCSGYLGIFHSSLRYAHEIYSYVYLPIKIGVTSNFKESPYKTLHISKF